MTVAHSGFFHRRLSCKHCKKVVFCVLFCETEGVSLAVRYTCGDRENTCSVFDCATGIWGLGRYFGWFERCKVHFCPALRPAALYNTIVPPLVWGRGEGDCRDTHTHTHLCPEDGPQVYNCTCLKCTPFGSLHISSSHNHSAHS